MIQPNLMIEMHGFPGGDKDEAAREALDIAKTWGVGVLLKCNGKRALITPKDSVRSAQNQLK